MKYSRMPWHCQRQPELRLPGTLIGSLDESIDKDAEALWAVEIEHRSAEIDAGEVQLVPRTQVGERLFRA